MSNLREGDNSESNHVDTLVYDLQGTVDLLQTAFYILLGVVLILSVLVGILCCRIKKTITNIEEGMILANPVNGNNSRELQEFGNFSDRNIWGDSITSIW